MRRARWTSWAILLAAATTSRAGPAAGPEFGSNTVATTIDPRGADPDVDDYVAALAAGERLTVRVAAVDESPLRPSLAIVGPDGVDAAARVETRRGGRTLVVRDF